MRLDTGIDSPIRKSGNNFAREFPLDFDDADELLMHVIHQ